MPRDRPKAHDVPDEGTHQIGERDEGLVVFLARIRRHEVSVHDRMADFLPGLDLISRDRGVGDERAHRDGGRDFGRSLHGADGRLLQSVVPGPGADVADQLCIGVKIGVLPPGSTRVQHRDQALDAAGEGHCPDPT